MHSHSMSSDAGTRRALVLTRHVVPVPCADSQQASAQAAELLLSAFSDPKSDRANISDANALPHLADLNSAMAVHRAMVTSPHAHRLGGHRGYKMGWKKKYPEQAPIREKVRCRGLPSSYKRGQNGNLRRGSVYPLQHESPVEAPHAPNPNPNSKARPGLVVAHKLLP